MIERNSVVMFVNGHKWSGCLGIVDETRKCGDDFRYMVRVPILPGINRDADAIPENEEGVPVPGYSSYIYVMDSSNSIVTVGKIPTGDMNE